MPSDFVGADFLKILIFFLVRYFATNFGLFFFLLQDNYTFAQPGIQMKVNALRELIQRIDGEQVGSLIFKLAPVLQESPVNLKFTFIRWKKVLDAGWFTLNVVMFYPDFVDLKL